MLKSGLAGSTASWFLYFEVSLWAFWDLISVLFYLFFILLLPLTVDFSSPYCQCCNYRDQQAMALTIGVTPKQTWKLTDRGKELLHPLWEAHLEMSEWCAQFIYSAYPEYPGYPEFICCTPRVEFETSESTTDGLFLQTGHVLPTHRKHITTVPKTLSSISKLSLWQGKQQTLSLPRATLSPCHLTSS